jgi:hypothetical protein
MILVRYTQKKPMHIKIIALFGLCGLLACNNNDTGSTTAPSPAATDSGARDTTATAAVKPVKKKRKTTITMPAAGTDPMMKDKNGVYNRTDVMPEFPGGQNALSDYINNNIEYGTNADDANVTGRLTYSFVVDEKGKVTDVQPVGNQQAGNGIDQQQVIKVLGNMPDWTPGTVKGKKVKTRLQLPMVFETE